MSTFPVRSKLTARHIVVFWGAQLGRTLDGMDSFIYYAFGLPPALTEFLPCSGYPATPDNVVGSSAPSFVPRGLGLSFIWEPSQGLRRFGKRAPSSGVRVLVYGKQFVREVIWRKAVHD